MKGIVPRIREILLGSAKTPKATRGYDSTLTSSNYYEGMDEDYRWFRQDELVRRCLVTNAYFSTLTAGFDTVLEGPPEYGYVKKAIDDVNKRVNLDNILFKTQLKRSIHGKTGFEVITGGDGLPSRLLPLQSSQLKPELDDSWQLTGYRYQGRSGFYGPDEILYFVNLSMEADYLGLSDVEPVRSVCRARHDLLREDFSEIVRSLWAPYTILQANTTGLGQEEADRVVKALASVARVGKSIAVNESVEAKVVNMTPDIRGLSQLLDRFDDSIIGCFGTPRFLLGRPVENRATAYAEFEAYVAGILANIQRYFKRELEAQWYDRLTRIVLELPEGAEMPLKVKHQWRPIRVTDIYEMAKVATSLWGNGDGPLSGRLAKIWELMGWDPSEVE